MAAHQISKFEFASTPMMYTPVFTSTAPTLSDNVFSNFADVKPVIEDTRRGTCHSCNVPMKLYGSDYNCPNCGLVEENNTTATPRESNGSSSIKISMNGRKSRIYSVTTDYSKTQKKQIFDQLVQNNNAYEGFKFSRDILSKVAIEYNNVQKSVTVIQKSGGQLQQKKFVKRGNIKDEVLAAFVYYECIRAGATRKKKDVAAMMKLNTGGFSTGETILRALHNAGKIDIPINDEPVDDYLDRYMETLNINDDSYRGFVLDIVGHSEALCIGMNSQISSKIVGAIWIVITNCGLGISAAALEHAADGIKKSTFIKFRKAVESNFAEFRQFYHKYNIPVIA